MCGVCSLHWLLGFRPGSSGPWAGWHSGHRPTTFKQHPEISVCHLRPRLKLISSGWIRKHHLLHQETSRTFPGNFGFSSPSAPQSLSHRKAQLAACFPANGGKLGAEKRNGLWEEELCQAGVQRLAGGLNYEIFDFELTILKMDNLENLDFSGGTWPSTLEIGEFRWSLEQSWLFVTASKLHHINHSGKLDTFLPNVQDHKLRCWGCLIQPIHIRCTLGGPRKAVRRKPPL